MAEQPPLSRIHVVGYSANDRDFPILNLVLDPRVAGYQVPKDLSACPDKRYPNHVFTGAQPISGDQRVRHVWEILPSPWVPFTRYDDDLGPIQGRRRFVINSQQEAVLERDKRVTYEAREGSALVSSEIEETWDAGSTDPDEPSPFPIKDRDFYEPSRGPVQERRQLVSTTGNEVASLENNNGIITQISYEAYNEYLSFKIVQTYSVDGPQWVGKTINNEGQIVTVTTQRKASDNYAPPQPTATLTFEALAEDKESLVERVSTIDQIFSGEVRSIERTDVLPVKFRSSIPTQSTQKSIEGTVADPQLASGDLAKSEQQITEFVKRTSRTFRDLSQPSILTGQVFTTEMGGGIATVTETYPSELIAPPETPEFGTIADEVESIGDGTRVRRQVKLKPKINFFPNDDGGLDQEESLPILVGQEYDQELDLVIPYKQLVSKADSTRFAVGNRKRVTPRDVVHSEVTRYDVEDVQDELDDYYWEIPEMIDVTLPDKLISVQFLPTISEAQGTGSGVGDTYSYSFTKRSSAGGSIAYDIEQGFRGTVPTVRAIFFLPKEAASPQAVLAKVNSKSGKNVKFWPNVRPQSHLITLSETSNESSESYSVSFDSVSQSETTGSSFSRESITIPPTIHEFISISSGSSNAFGSVRVTPNSLSATEVPKFPTGFFLYQINATPYRFSYVRVDALLVEILQDYV